MEPVFSLPANHAAARPFRKTTTVETEATKPAPRLSATRRKLRTLPDEQEQAVLDDLVLLSGRLRGITGALTNMRELGASLRARAEEAQERAVFVDGFFQKLEDRITRGEPAGSGVLPAGGEDAFEEWDGMTTRDDITGPLPDFTESTGELQEE